MRNSSRFKPNSILCRKSVKFVRNFLGNSPKNNNVPSLATIGALFTAGILVAASPELSTPPTSLTLAMWCAGSIWILARFGLRERAWLAVVFTLGGARMTVDQLAGAAVPTPPGVTIDDRVPERVVGTVAGPVITSGGRLRFALAVDGPMDVRLQVTTRVHPTTSDGAEASSTAPPRPLPGDLVRVTGRVFRPRGYRVSGARPSARLARAQGIDLTVFASQLEVLERDHTWTIWRAATRAHRQVVETLRERGGDPAGNAIMRALIAGDRDALDPAMHERYRIAGVAHVLAVSGLHLAVVSALAFAFVRRIWAAMPELALRVPPALAGALVAAPIAVGYTLMTGGRTSTMRALFMVLVVLGGAAMARRARLLDALGLAASILLALRPCNVFDPGFQLSFAATATLLLLARTGRHHSSPDTSRPGRPVGLAMHGWRAVWRAVWRLIAVSAWASLATAPLVALAFAEISLGGVFTNVVAVPLTELFLVPLGMLGVGLHQLSPSVGGWLLDLTIAMAGGLDRAVSAVAGILPHTPVSIPDRWQLLGWLLVWAGAIPVRLAWSRWRRAALIAAGLLLALGSWMVHSHLAPAWRDHVRITFLDVGQGDAAVIELPGGGVWLIDGGGLPFVHPGSGGPGDSAALQPSERRRLAATPGRLSVARFLAHRHIGRIDLLIISHPHPDHYEGLHALLGRFAIDEVWIARGHRPPPPSQRDLLRALRAGGARVHYPELDRPYKHGRISLTVLAPRYLEKRAAEDPVVATNDNSLVVRLDAFGRSVLFAGDLEREGEELLLARHPGLPVDVVKVPHHGSRTSSTPAFVQATRPSFAVVSCGRANRFGFPAAEVVTRWRAAGARVLRTDQHGAVTVLMEPGGRLRVQTFD